MHTPAELSLARRVLLARLEARIATDAAAVPWAITRDATQEIAELAVAIATLDAAAAIVNVAEHVAERLGALPAIERHLEDVARAARAACARGAE